MSEKSASAGALLAFEAEVRRNIEGLRRDEALHRLSTAWIADSHRHKYSYNFTWLGRPIIQLPQDILAMQEIVWRVRPDVIVETGIAHGGSLIFYASMLHLIGGGGRVIGIDIDIRKHNRVEIESHPMAERIIMLEGSSTDPAVVNEVRALVGFSERTIICLDSNHTHDHVLRELRVYSPFVRRGGYLVVFDTIIEDLPDVFFTDRPWGKGNNPRSAVDEFLRTDDRFVIDSDVEGKLLISVAPGGYLKCIKD